MGGVAEVHEMIAFLLLNWRVLAIVGVIVAALGGTHIKAYQMGGDHEVATQAREDAQIAKAVDTANATAAEAIAKIRPRYTTISNKLEKQLEKETVFHDCRLDSTSMQLANQALSGGSETPSDSKLPEADAPSK